MSDVDWAVVESWSNSIINENVLLQNCAVTAMVACRIDIRVVIVVSAKCWRSFTVSVSVYVTVSFNRLAVDETVVSEPTRDTWVTVFVVSTNTHLETEVVVSWHVAHVKDSTFQRTITGKGRDTVYHFIEIPVNYVVGSTSQSKVVLVVTALSLPSVSTIPIGTVTEPEINVECMVWV